MHPRRCDLAINRVGVVSVDLLGIAASRCRGLPHRREQPGLRVEQGPGVEELRHLVGGELLPTARKRLEIDLARREDHLDFQQDPTLVETHAGVQVGRMGIALSALHRLAGAGEARDLHLEVESLDGEHVLAGLLEQGRRVRRLWATRPEPDDDHESGEHRVGPRGSGGRHQPLRIRSSPTRRVIFWASSHSSKGRT